jgi:hypothetical protein
MGGTRIPCEVDGFLSINKNKNKIYRKLVGFLRFAKVEHSQPLSSRQRKTEKTRGAGEGRGGRGSIN